MRPFEKIEKTPKLIWSILQDYKENGKHQRLGQFFCNKYDANIDDLFYEEDNKESIVKITDYLTSLCVNIDNISFIDTVFRKGLHEVVRIDSVYLNSHMKDDLVLSGFYNALNPIETCINLNDRYLNVKLFGLSSTERNSLIKIIRGSNLYKETEERLVSSFLNVKWKYCVIKFNIVVEEV